MRVGAILGKAVFINALNLKNNLKIILDSQEVANKYTGKPHTFSLISPNVNIFLQL